MKKTKKTMLTAAILTSAISMSSCNWTSTNDVQDVYGPPVDVSDSYNPQDDNMQSEYEAPIAYEEEPTTEEATTTKATTTKATTTEATTTTEETPTYNPEDEYLQTDYGCPVVIEPETSEYKPAKDVPSLVYGPPPDLD